MTKPAVEEGLVQENAEHPDNEYSPALVEQAVAVGESPAWWVAHLTDTSKVDTSRLDSEFMTYPTVEEGLVQEIAEHPDSE